MDNKVDEGKRTLLETGGLAALYALLEPREAAASWIDPKEKADVPAEKLINEALPEPDSQPQQTPGIRPAGDPAGELTLESLSPAIKNRVARIWGGYLQARYRDGTLEEDLEEALKTRDRVAGIRKSRPKTDAELQSRNKAPAWSAVEEFSDVLGRRVDNQWAEAILGGVEGFAGRKRYQAQRNDDIDNSVNRDKAQGNSNDENRIIGGILDNNNPQERNARREAAEQKANEAFESVIKTVLESRAPYRTTLSEPLQERWRQNDDNIMRNIIIPQMQYDIEMLFSRGVLTGIEGQGRGGR